MSVGAVQRPDRRPAARHLPQRTVSEQSQLDDILQDLLADPQFLNNKRSFEWANDAEGTYGSITPYQGSITTHSGHGGGGRTVVSWQMNQTGPKSGSFAVNRHIVDRPTANSFLESDAQRRLETSTSTTSGGRYESRRVETRTEKTTRRDGLGRSSSDSGVTKPQPPSPPVRRRLFSPESHTAPTRRTEPETEVRPSYANRNYASDTDDPSVSSRWLDEQRGKLQSTRQQRNWRPAPAAVVQSDTEDYFRPSGTDRGRGGRGTRTYDLESGRLYETKKSFFVSGIERPARPGPQTKYTFSVSPQRSLPGDEFPSATRGVQKPPPVPPAPARSSTSPVLPPLRSDSSREAVQRVYSTRDFTTSTRTHNELDEASLDELEKSLQDVHTLLEATPVVKTQQAPAQSAPPLPVEEMMTANKMKPDEAGVEVEEEIISLQPIGPGVQNLEPEGPLRQRSLTPAFPAQPVTPPFSVGRKMPQGNQGFPASPVNDVRTPTRTQPTEAAPPSFDRYVEEFATLSQTNAMQNEISPPMRPAESRSGESVTHLSQTEATPRGLLPQSPVTDTDASMPIYQTPRRQYPQQQQQQPVEQQQLFSGGGSNLMTQNVVQQQQHHQQHQMTTNQGRLDGIQTGPIPLQYQQPSAQVGNLHQGSSTNYNSQSAAAVQQGFIQQQQRHVSEQLQGSSAVQHQQMQYQQPLLQTTNIQQSYAFSSESPQVASQQQHLHHQQASKGLMQQGVVTGGFQSGKTSAATQEDEFVGFLDGLIQTDNSAGMQHGTRTGGTQGFAVETQVKQQQQHQQQQPIVVEDYSASRIQQTSNQKSTQVINGPQGAGGGSSGLLTITTRPRSPASPTSPMSAGNVSPSDAMLRARLQSRLDTRSPGMASLTGGRTSPSIYFGQSRTGSLSSLGDGGEVLQHSPRFVRDTSKYWHKPHITREEAISMLKNKPPGSFVVRNSNTFQGAFGLALKVAQIPPNVQTKEGGDPQSELVRHFLIEPTSKGVRLKGCSNEPVFGSLAALVYQHTLTPLALPCKLILPEFDINEVETVDSGSGTNKAQLYGQGAACNVLYVNSVDMESLTGPEALSRAISSTFSSSSPPPFATVVHFKVSSQGITLTDNRHRLFFRRHYPIDTVTFCGVDAKDRRWTVKLDDSQNMDCKVFGFVARKPGSTTGNACHVFAEMDPNQPANAIVNFLTKVMIGQGHFMKT